MKFEDIDDDSFKNWVKTVEEEITIKSNAKEQEIKADFTRRFGDRTHFKGSVQEKENAANTVEKDFNETLKNEKSTIRQQQLGVQFKDIEDFTQEKYEARKKELEAKAEREQQARIAAEQEKKKQAAKEAQTVKEEQKEQRRKAAEIQENQAAKKRIQEEMKTSSKAASAKANQEKRAAIKKTQDENLEAQRKALRERFNREVSGRQYEQKQNKGQDKSL